MFVFKIPSQIFSNIVGRDIIYIPVNKSSAHIFKNYNIIRSDCREPDSDPMTILWFEETKFGVGHYQSIVSTEGSRVLEHYWLESKKNSSTITPDLASISRMTITSLDAGSPGQPQFNSSSIQVSFTC